MIGSYTPTPVFLGDTFGSTLAIMLFPDSLPKARHWHAKHLSKGPLQAYLEAGHTFDDRLLAFTQAVGEGDVSEQDVLSRLTRGGLAADTIKVLWALICDNDSNASWAKAINIVCDATLTGQAGSPSHIRSQLKLFAPVLHLWLAWRLSDHCCPREDELYRDGYAILFAMRGWARSRPESFRTPDSYLGAKEYGPWPQLAREMERAGGSPLRIISLRQPV